MYTDYRPTPLQHYMFPAGGDGLHMIVDERGVFREDSFQRAVAALTAKDGLQDAEGGVSSLRTDRTSINTGTLTCQNFSRQLLQPRWTIWVWQHSSCRGTDVKAAVHA